MAERLSRTAASVAEVVLTGAVILVGLFGVLAPALGPGGLGVGSGSVLGEAPTVAATVDASEVRVETTPGLPHLADRGEIARGEGVEFTAPTGTTVAVYDPDLRQRVGLTGASVLTGLVAALVLAMLLLIVRSLRRGDPFVEVNARRLYVIAAAVGLGAQGAVLLGAWGRAGVLQHPLVAPYVLQEHDVTFLPLFAGLGVAVLAEVFRQGTALRREVEGLV